VYDDEMQKQMKEKNSKPTLGRFHGFSASGVTLAEFQRIMNSVHPVRVDKTKPQVAATPPPKIHPKVFNLIDCWLSDSEAPVVTEINLDAVAKDGNEFQDELVKEEAGWIRCPTADTNGGFMRYRVVEQKGDRYKIEYQENGGGSLTTTSTIEFVIDKREVSRDGKSETMRVLRVVGYQHNY
jgi:hypothetical protein